MTKRLVRDEVPIATYEVAKARIQVHLDNCKQVEYSLEKLAINCYLQGCTDMAETLIQRECVLDESKEEIDYQI